MKTPPQLNLLNYVQKIDNCFRTGLGRFTHAVMDYPDSRKQGGRGGVGRHRAGPITYHSYSYYYTSTQGQYDEERRIGKERNENNGHQDGDEDEDEDHEGNERRRPPPPLLQSQSQSTIGIMYWWNYWTFVRVGTVR